MENNIPNINNLKIKLQGYDNQYEFDENSLYVVISIITIFPGFRQFLEKKGYDEEYELTTIIFGQIIDYIEESFKKDNLNDIIKLLSFLDILSISKNDKIVDLLLVGFLENLDNYKEILPDIIKLMPDNLKKLFMKYYSHYLD